MRFQVKISVFIVLPLTAAACATTEIPVPSGEPAYALMDQVANPSEARAYRVGDGDTLRINVFSEPDVSLQEVVVDISGNVTVPLIGDVAAVGRTNNDLASEIGNRLSRYLVEPRVTVAILKSTTERVFVEGQVNKAGVFDLQGDVTLLGALAMAEGTTDISDTRQVLIFRTIDGKRQGAKFDIAQIRTGAQPDPRILPQDLVVVGTSSTKRWVRDLIQMSPLLGSAFVALVQN